MIKKVITYLACIAVIAAFCSSCGIIARVFNPTRHEKKVQAEFDLSSKEYKNKKILVLVKQPAWLNARVNLRSRLTKNINRELTDKLKIRTDLLVGYDEISDYRSSLIDLSSFSPMQAAKQMNADLLLSVAINNCKLNQIENTGYFEAFLRVNAELYNAGSGKKLWPDDDKARSVSVGFEIGPKGTSAAADRLANSMAHCIVRYLYNCPVDQFKTFDDRTGSVSERW